jgi:hypothetical protein
LVDDARLDAMSIMIRAIEVLARTAWDDRTLIISQWLLQPHYAEPVRFQAQVAASHFLSVGRDMNWLGPSMGLPQGERVELEEASGVEAAFNSMRILTQDVNCLALIYWLFSNDAHFSARATSHIRF